MARRALAALLALACCLGGARAQATVADTAAGSSGTPGTYDPCLPPPTGVKRGDPFVFGLAFWPGGLVSDWGAPYNTTTGAPGLNPCLDAPVTGADGTNFGTYQEYLTSKGVVFGTYMIKVDTIAAARTTRAEMTQIWKAVTEKFVADDQVISVIAFRGQNRSEAQYVISNSPGRTDGTGIVQQLSLMVAWDRGTFNGLTWYNGGPCDSCGGMSSSKCIQTQYQPDYQQYTQSTCAWTFDECACNATNPLQCAASNCTSAIYVGHRGSDKPGRTMKTGSQIQKINQFSITSFFWRLLDSAFNLLGNAGIGTADTASISSTTQPTGPLYPAAMASEDKARGGPELPAGSFQVGQEHELTSSEGAIANPQSLSQDDPGATVGATSRDVDPGFGGGPERLGAGVADVGKEKRIAAGDPPLQRGQQQKPA
ncbi:Armadillo repeat-containing 8 [Chlorella sorokiniana]|uniref:Armadillo repeat-containing 8 n=1 Tax=Chlorella sorokiniana TaxID=3076 RepID=A0A2P6TWM3_CHLSO|nr:Armadillo repeat-containing 8 [Chlorella sorokiniana]|eukprot:PRW58472.1 Armadillo repeat-containing 8 [Chlorella sorokiniana]